MNKTIRFQLLATRVAIITLDTPDSKFNVLSAAVMAELDASLDNVAADRDIQGLVIRSAKEGSFIAGADLQEIIPLQSLPSAQAYEAAQLGKKIFAKIAAFRFPTVAAINGLCLGGGTELALACKFRIAANSPEVSIGLPEVGLGFLPGWGGTVRLPKLVGASTALDMILNPLKAFEARKAWKSGVVDELVPPEQLVTRAVEIARGAKVKRAGRSFQSKISNWFMDRTRLGRYILNRMTSKGIYAGTRGNYPAPPAALKVALAALTQPADKAFELESQVFGQLATTSVSANLVGIHMATQEAKKSPNSVAPSIDVEEVGVVGAGVMGSGIAQSALNADYKVTLYDNAQAGLDKGVANIKALFANMVEKGKATQAEVDKKLARLTATTKLEDLCNCDMVIEAIVEDMGAKKKLLANLEKVILKPFIFATNTSSLSVTEMAADALNPGNVVGLHYFNPVHKMQLVEVIRGAKSSESAIAVLKAYGNRIKKKAVTTADAPGFLVNRILAPYLYEAIRLIAAGVPLKDIDDAIKRFGLPMGPLELLDEIGLDTSCKVIHVLHKALGERMAPPAIIKFIEDSKLLGKKGGKGIYLYDKAGKRLGFNPEFTAALAGVTASPRSRTEIQDRLMLVMVNEAARCIEEGIVTDPAQIDLAMLYGMGFPAFRGGVVRYGDTIGSRALVQKLEWLASVSGDNYRPAALLRSNADRGVRFYR